MFPSLKTACSSLLVAAMCIAATGALTDSACNLRIYNNPDIDMKVVGCNIQFCDPANFTDDCRVMAGENVGGTISAWCSCDGAGYNYPSCRGYAVWDVESLEEVPKYQFYYVNPNAISCVSTGCFGTCVWNNAYPDPGKLEVPCNCN